MDKKEKSCNSLQAKTAMLLDLLPDIASSIIRDITENKTFKMNPDDAKEHAPEWHQYGIITHSNKFVEMMKSKVPEKLLEWGIKDRIDKILDVEIDSVRKRDLLCITGVLHDIGKFARDFKIKDGKIAPDYSRHEAYSRQLILGIDKFKTANQNGTYIHDLLQKGFTKNQINYIATTAGLHYVLGRRIRKPVESANDYSFAYIRSRKCVNVLESIIDEHPDYCIEIGYLFLCDNFSSHEFVISANDDVEIEQEIIRLGYRNNPVSNALVNAIHNYPVNEKLAYNYLIMAIDSSRLEYYKLRDELYAERCDGRC